ncbi:MAG: hypothetical protein ACRDOH_34985 [Streptosporangiaceae bacterium]
MSTNRTVVRLVTAQSVGGAELADPGLDLALQCLKPGELIHPAGQLLKVSDDQRAHRGVTLRGGDPGVAVDVIQRAAAACGRCPAAAGCAVAPADRPRRRGAADDAGLEVVTADLMADDGWKAAMAGCEEVHHVASPIPVAQPTDPAS